jgi:hypothetical protein
MLRLAVRSDILSFIRANRDHPGVLPGAVSVDGSEMLPSPEELIRRSGVARRVRPVVEVAFGKPSFMEKGFHGGDVPLLALVGGARDGEFLVRKPESVRRAGEGERHRLKRLYGGARKEIRLGVSGGFEDAPFRVGEYETSAMDAFDESATF